ncbi:hypothetical protein NM208_g536 [Fusarium decemcellulare]|uniref:Uncharacterized protein n=2 Tax=Fusarium decemcellulare TaxID=57161 RepID=A0ACC1SAP6_9HYPO|nr:hypothetical protein NM208_g7094 [Fusarium decemcellulare]KAJ3549380.1 hypothetical protein NM208_g536 [Fusarium decemcellulare]
MDPSQTSDYARKRRRFHDELSSRYQGDYEDYLEPNPQHQHQIYPAPTYQDFSAASQSIVGAATDVNPAILPHDNGRWHGYSPQWQQESRGPIQDSWCQPEHAGAWHLPGAVVSTSSCPTNPWALTFPPPPIMGFPIPREPAHNYISFVDPGFSHQLPVAPSHAPINPRPLPNALIEETFIPTIHGGVMVTHDSASLTPYTPGQVRKSSEGRSVGKVCFGMVPGISAKCDRKGSPQALLSPFSVKIESSTHFTSQEYPEISGQILSEHGQMIQGLLDEDSLDLYISCTTNESQSVTSQRPSRSSAPIQCTLEITVYGPLDIFDEIGTWFDEYHVFLQDPRHCHLDVKYYNPHRLSADDITSCPLVSEVVTQTSKVLHLENRTQQDDLLDMLGSHEDLEETPQPTVIKGAMRRQVFSLIPPRLMFELIMYGRHQKQALTFMLRRERGWAFYDQQPDVWEMVDTDHERFFVNRISNAHQSQEPPQCYGGIIADPMGLGKTLTMIALAATDIDNYSTHINTEETEQLAVSATLIVVPPPLLGTWEEQISEHVVDHGLAYRRHHRETRLSSTNELEDCNIVLTTYHTVSADWNTGRGVGISALFSVRWRRVILDEAHVIRNANSKISQAVCALASESRWAVTGTPIQNRLSDLATLFKFIRAYPYTDRRCFEADISRLWKSGEYQEAVKRLKRLSACLLLRRPKDTVSLPARQDLQCPVDFSQEERTLYNKLRQQAIMSIDEALKLDADASKAGIYVNVLQQIESLRLVCNLGLRYLMRHDKTMHGPKNADNWESIAQAAFNVQREMGPVVCSQCSSTLEIAESLLDDPAVAQQSSQFHSCRIVECGHNPRCPLAPVSTNVNALESTLDEMQPQGEAGHVNLPSKVEALITDIKTLPPNDKCIIFSTWRLTLDVVETGLNQASIRSVRFDGKVPQKERQCIVDRFRADPSIRVMLLTLSCGAAGLTLTAATRAYLMEPHWNPTLEEQALARIHRIGQTREVTTVRFYQVMEVQESKKHLAGVLLSPHDGAQADESLGRLEMLRSLI